MKTYLGDGLYAEYDGWQIKLTAEREGMTHVVYLDPYVYKSLLRYHEAILAAHAKQLQVLAGDTPPPEADE